MATKKKSRKKATKPKKAARKKAPIMKTAKRSRKLAKKKSVLKQTQKKASSKKQARRRSSPQRALSGRKPVRRSGDLAGDLQGLSRREAADSESVDELLEEGNAFEADAVMGVQEADNMEGREVHTREVPEDDVPGEYLDED
jgi:hypothetical protein